MLSFAWSACACASCESGHTQTSSITPESGASSTSTGLPSFIDGLPDWQAGSGAAAVLGCIAHARCHQSWVTGQVTTAVCPHPPPPCVATCSTQHPLSCCPPSAVAPGLHRGLWAVGVCHQHAVVPVATAGGQQRQLPRPKGCGACGVPLLCRLCWHHLCLCGGLLPAGAPQVLQGKAGTLPRK